MAYTDAEMLELIDTAIADVLANGQTVSADGDSWTKSDLRELRAMRKEYAGKVAGASGSIFDRTKNAIPYRG
uniref:Uncharacterized protein n=1 Tax=viral metagenome TaxID=1070528 RepID=A0A6M3J343_9ZZZZ